MSTIHLWAHMDKNLVRKGDTVKAYETVLGTIGDGNGQWFAHNHQSESVGLTLSQILSYEGVSNWQFLNKHYRNPALRMNVESAYGRKMDVGNMGFNFLQPFRPYINRSGWHPGIDINGLGGGDTDFGYSFKSHIDGVVVYEKRTWFKNGGWGNVIAVEEKELSCDEELAMYKNRFGQI